MILNKFQKFAALAVLAAPGLSFAVGPAAGDLSGLTPDATSILAAIVAVGVIALGVTLAMKGFRIVKAMTKTVG